MITYFQNLQYQHSYRYQNYMQGLHKNHQTRLQRIQTTGSKSSSPDTSSSEAVSFTINLYSYK
jgi:hypothetical protein